MVIGTSSGKSYPDAYTADVDRYEQSQNLSPVVSDVSPDTVQPGQQYAMMNQPVYPQMEGLTAEIDRLATGGVPGPGRGQPLTEIGLQSYNRTLRDLHMTTVEGAAGRLREAAQPPPPPPQRYEQIPFEPETIPEVVPVVRQPAPRALTADEIVGHPASPLVRLPTEAERRQTLRDIGISESVIDTVIPPSQPASSRRSTAQIVQDAVSGVVRRIMPGTTGPLPSRPVTGAEAAPHIPWDSYASRVGGEPIKYPDISVPKPYKDQSVFLENLSFPSKKSGDRMNVMAVGDNYVYDHGAPYSFIFRGKDGKVYGDIHLTPAQQTDFRTGKTSKQLHVDFINVFDPDKPYSRHTNEYQKDTETANRFFSVGYMPNILRQLKSMFPEADELSGLRISGALAKRKAERRQQAAGARDRGSRQTIRLPELDENDLRKESIPTLSNQGDYIPDIRE